MRRDFRESGAEEAEASLTMEGLEEEEDLALIESLGVWGGLKLRGNFIKLEGRIWSFAVHFWLLENAREGVAEMARRVRAGMSVVILGIAKLKGTEL